MEVPGKLSEVESGLTLGCGVTDNHFQGSLSQGQPERRCFSDSEMVRLSHLAEKETEALRNEIWIVVHLGATGVCVCVCVCQGGGSLGLQRVLTSVLQTRLWATAFSIYGEPGSGERCIGKWNAVSLSVQSSLFRSSAKSGPQQLQSHLQHQIGSGKSSRRGESRSDTRPQPEVQLDSVFTKIKPVLCIEGFTCWWQ